MSLAYRRSYVIRRVKLYPPSLLFNPLDSTIIPPTSFRKVRFSAYCWGADVSESPDMAKYYMPKQFLGFACLSAMYLIKPDGLGRASERKWLFHKKLVPFSSPLMSLNV